MVQYSELGNPPLICPNCGERDWIVGQSEDHSKDNVEFTSESIGTGHGLYLYTKRICKECGLECFYKSPHGT